MRSHRTLFAWQEAREVSRACINIAEGYGLATAPQFRRHIHIAYGSALEAGELFELGLEIGVIAAEHAHVLARCEKSQRLLLRLLKKKGMKPMQASIPT